MTIKMPPTCSGPAHPRTRVNMLPTTIGDVAQSRKPCYIDPAPFPEGFATSRRQLMTSEGLSLQA